MLVRVRQRSTSWRSCGLGCWSLGWRYIGPAPSEPGSLWQAARCEICSMYPVISAHEVLTGRRHGDHGPSVLPGPSAGKLLDTLGRHAGQW